MLAAAIAIGNALGVLIAIAICSRVIPRLSAGCSRPRFVRNAAILGSALGSFPAFIVALVEGINFAEPSYNTFGAAGTLIGLGAGIAVVFGIGLAGSAWLLAFTARKWLQITERRDNSL